ncbi:phosphatidylserine/phosphatidylglycerophosphate/cardiolipin synthase-like enzyme [Allocatelliglobosispora scoriae]|uniref:phospholipase D n=1 Tax=Allocatelliglobosispora scoriae TaxID=643052 RepID=A0A841BFT3_9ACTN|nr:phospholipase D-like domain-containing protein [Allocatelliglobosispora scoriae]MBB5867947.1 phosphatidylserine/phosphatidylglycerophosphate/cardiolipin synthase-like enzyme [Allocatelliglobosispora scoriae]
MKLFSHVGHLRRAAVVAVLAATGALLPITPAMAAVHQASATIGGYPVWAHFANPTAGRDYTIITELQRLIDNASAGSTVKGTIHSLSIDSVADALLRAQTRGVTVMVVIDGKNAPSTDPAVTTIKKLTNHKFCTNANGGTGCMSTSPDGDMHTKMFTFTSTTDPAGVRRGNVSWFGSANLTYATGTDAFNNTITVYGDTALFSGLNANFSDLWNRRHYSGNDYYDSASGRGYYQATAADAYASPEGAGQTDTIATRLNDLTPTSSCRLRIGMASVTSGRPKVVDVVKSYRSGGCNVWMAVGTDSSGGISMTESVYDELLAAGVAIHRKDDIHNKFFMAYGSYGGTYQYRVYTGSQNWTQDALNENEELFVKMGPETGTAHPLYDAYYTHFNEAYNTGTACTKTNYPCR